MKRLFLFLTVAAAVCCAACSDDPEVAESNLSLLEDNVTFDMFGGRSVLEITADSPWTVSCDDDWCRTNVAEGSHTKKIVLTVDQSFLPERTTAVRFYAAGEEKHTVTVTQEKFEPILVLAEDGADITVYGAGSEPALNLRASVAWKIEGATDWCAVSQSEGTKKFGRETVADRRRRGRASAQRDADRLLRDGGRRTAAGDRRAAVDRGEYGRGPGG